LYQSQTLDLLHSTDAVTTSNPGETERDFRIRLQTTAREQRDAATEAIRQKFAPKMVAIQERIRRAQQAVERETQQASAQKLQTAISFGATLLGALMGRKAISTSTIGRATTAARGVGRTMKEAEDIRRAGETVEVMQGQLADLEQQVQAETQAVAARYDLSALKLETVSLKPKKTQITVQLVALAWQA
ncbi:MAG: ATP-binding protein, partial [Acidobacteria bacterium]|nr:ATP-binding protein [Acidobacteriota bacterium]